MSEHGSYPTFRLELPTAGQHGFATAGRTAKAFVTWPGEEERELRGVTNVEPLIDISGVIQTRVTFVGSCTVAYAEELSS